MQPTTAKTFQETGNRFSLSARLFNHLLSSAHFSTLSTSFLQCTAQVALRIMTTLYAILSYSSKGSRISPSTCLWTYILLSFLGWRRATNIALFCFITSRLQTCLALQLGSPKKSTQPLNFKTSQSVLWWKRFTIYLEDSVTSSNDSRGVVDVPNSCQSIFQHPQRSITKHNRTQFTVARSQKKVLAMHCPRRYENVRKCKWQWMWELRAVMKIMKPLMIPAVILH